ncbi:MAG: hypothetical protein K2J76_07675 [Oscillospiraceae bacterium]|nr:hypothetical protein [Oscillospiraceae bacterium]
MENIRKQAKKTLKIYIAILIASILLFVVFNAVEAAGGANNSSTFGRGFCAGVIAFMAINILRYASALKNDEKLKKLYISATDEREKLICEKSDVSAFKVILCIVVLSAMVASFYSDMVFYTLIAVMLTIIFVKAGFRFYYRRKF